MAVGPTSAARLVAGSTNGEQQQAAVAAMVVKAYEKKKKATTDCVEEVGSSVETLRGRGEPIRSGGHGLHLCRDQLGHLAEVLGGGGEEKLVSGSERAA